MNRPLRPLLGALSLTLAMGAACEKSDSSSPPEPADALAEVDDGKTRLKYPEGGFSLQATIEQTTTVSGNATGEQSVKADGSIVATPIEGGKLRVELTNGENVEYVAKGAFEDKPEEGEEPTDMVALLRGAKSYGVMDRIGDVDEDATKALPENVERRARAEARKKSEDEMAVRELEASSVLELPNLPTTGLVEGEAVKLDTREETVDTPGGDMPVEIDATYMLKSLSDEGGKQLATVDIEILTSGAAELSFGEGSTFVAFDAELTGTLVFDMSAGLPVSWDAEQLTEFHVGERTFEQNSFTKASYAAAP